MTLSVIIPTHNTCALVERCIRSVLAHAGNAEILVVDDASQDGTARALAALATSAPAVTVLRRDSQGGFARAANLGLQRAAGELLLLLNSDTELAAGARPAIEAAFAAHSRLGILGASLHYPNGSWQWSGGREPGVLWCFALASGLGKHLGAARRAIRGAGRGTPSTGPAELRFVDWVSGAAMTVRRPAFADCGTLDESFAFYAQDLDYCRRAADAGWRIAVSPAWHVVHRHGATVGGAGPNATRAAAGFQRLDHLWSDLLLWLLRRHGPARAKAARRALLVGGTLRWALATQPQARDAVRAAIARIRRAELRG